MPAAKPLSQALWACQLPFQGRFERTNLLPPLGVVLRAANQDSNDCRWQSYLCFVPRSGKGGAVGSFKLFPFNEPHPLSQPCRFRSAVKSASSPSGEPSGLLRIRLGYHEAIGACRKTPLRLAKSRLTAVARLHGACGRTSQAVRPASSPFRGAFLAAPFGGGAPRSESG